MTRSEEVYPHKQWNTKDKSGRKWRVEYELAYDGGGCVWTGYYRTIIGARTARFMNLRFFSWGGSARIFRNKREK